MYADGTRHLGKPRDRFLDLLPAHHHQIGKLVDNYDDIGQNAMRIAIVVPLFKRVAPFGLDVVAVDIADAITRQILVTTLHLSYRPAECNRCPFGVGNDRRLEVRDVGVKAELEPLRIDHDEFHLVGARLVEYRHDKRIDAHRFPGPRRHAPCPRRS